jgi:hypothetical protein
MVFPAVWAAAVVDVHIKGIATKVIATDAMIRVLENWRDRIKGTFP